MTEATKNSGLSQLDKFKEAARELECDDDERRFDERMKKPGEKHECLVSRALRVGA